MNVTRKKCVSSFFYYSFWKAEFIKYSTTTRTQESLENTSYSKKNNEYYIKSFERKRIQKSLFDSEIGPFINKSRLPLLNSYITFRSKPSYSFVVDSTVAKDIVEKILPELKQEKSWVVEANPGVGLITLNLIKSQVPRIQIFDCSQLKHLSLQQLVNEYPHQLKLHNCNLFTHNFKHLALVLDTAINLGFKNKIIAVFQQTSYFSCFVQECVNISLWDHLKVTDFFFVVSKNVWNTFKNDSSSQVRYLTYCIFNLIFKIELLAEYPCTAFLPIPYFNKEENMFFVKISKKPNFPGELSNKDVKLLLNVCKILTRRKNSSIIQTLEQWIPDCGPYLISKGISVSNQINDLSYDEFKKLFLFLKVLQDFKHIEVII